MNDSIGPKAGGALPGSGSKPKAIVVGASMAGLFAASFLNQAGWDAHVYERSEIELFGRGAGIVTHAELLRALEQAGASLQDLGVSIRDRVALDRSGVVTEHLDFPQIVTSWDRLHQLMRATVPAGHHHLGHHLTSVEQGPGGVVAHFANGRSERADLLIGADGFRSAVRAQYLPHVLPVYSGYVIWRGVANEDELPSSTRDAIFEKFAFFLPPRNKVIGYPIAGEDNDLRPGHRRYNWVWYRPVERSEMAEMLVGSDGIAYDYSVPPPLTRPDVVEAMRREAKVLLPTVFNDMLEHIERPFFTPIYDHISPQAVFGRVALIGDALSVARPHIGMGVTKAAEDARVLTAHLSAGAGSVERLLAAFEAERLPIAVKAVARGRDLGDYMRTEMQAEDLMDPAARPFNDDDVHSPRGILEHTASSAFLQQGGRASHQSGMKS